MVFVFLAGISVGVVAVTWFVPQSPSLTSAVVTPAPLDLRCEEELAGQKARIEELEGRLGRLSTKVEVAPTQSDKLRDAAPSPAQDTEEQRHEALSWRVSAIEKFVPLSEDQKNRLLAAFEEDSRARQAGEDSRAEKLEEILGEDNARYYRAQIKAAFERVQNEENEKEVLLLSRQLNLAADQEQAVRSQFLDVERVVDEEFSSGTHGSGASPQERVKVMIAENKRRRALREERLKTILSADQYEAYLRAESESAASDVEVFHDPGQ